MFSELFEELHGEILDESVGMAFRRKGGQIRKAYRCLSGRKRGRLVSDPRTCHTRVDPLKSRRAKRAARINKAARVRKITISKKQAASKAVSRMNARLRRRKR